MIKIIASVLGLISKVKAHESCCSGHSHDHDEHIEQQEEEPWLSTLDIVVLGAAGKNSKSGIAFKNSNFYANFLTRKMKFYLQMQSRFIQCLRCTLLSNEIFRKPRTNYLK